MKKRLDERFTLKEDDWEIIDGTWPIDEKIQEFKDYLAGNPGEYWGLEEEELEDDNIDKEELVKDLNVIIQFLERAKEVGYTEIGHNYHGGSGGTTTNWYAMNPTTKLWAEIATTVDVKTSTEWDIKL